MTVLATDATRLADEEVFYFGNAIGESGNQPGNAIVNATDEILARNFPHSPLNPAAIDDLYDYDRDELVNGTDQVAARNHQTNPLSALRLIWPPASDAAFAKGIEQPSKGLANDLVDPVWLYEAAQADKTAAATSTKGNPADDAVDRLLATYWT